MQIIPGGEIKVSSLQSWHLQQDVPVGQRVLEEDRERAAEEEITANAW